MITAENVFLRQLMNSNESWVGCHCDLLTLWSKFRAPRPIIQSCNISQISKIPWIKWYFFISSSHDKVLPRIMKVDWNWIASNVSLTKFLLLFPLGIEIIKSLIPTTDQKKSLIILSRNRTPLHTPNGSFKLYWKFFLHCSLSEGNYSPNRSERQCLPISAPSRTNDFLSAFFFWDFLFAWSVKSEICSTSTEKFVGQWIEAKS